MTAKIEHFSRGVQTIDELMLTLPLRTLPHAVMIGEMRVIGYDGTRFHTIKISMSVLCTGTIATIQAQQSDNTLDKGPPPWKAQLSASGATIYLNLTGARNTTITWSVEGTLQVVEASL